MDPTYILIIAGTVLCLLAQAKVKSAYSRYSRIGNRQGLTGRETAARILAQAGLSDVSIEHIGGSLSDYYDPRSKKVCLSDATYNATSIAALAVAAHECGHAIQHQQGYSMIKIRSAMVPVVNFSAAISWPLVIVGFCMSGRTSVTVLTLGVILFSFSVLFQFVTLPVEFNASSRAIKILRSNGMLYDDEIAGAKRMLSAAALTYVANTVAVLLQFLRLVLIISMKRNSRD